MNSIELFRPAPHSFAASALRPSRALACVLWIGLAALAAPGATAEKDQPEGRVAALIAQLGAPDFAEREDAQAQLGQIGLEAFDALLDAEQSDDIEVQLRARYLVRSMNVRWFTENDPPEVVRLLKNYGDQDSEVERISRMERLAQLPDRAGLAALCRLTRFDVKPVLSKKAALLILSQTEVPEKKAAHRETIEAAIGRSKRPAAAWLRLYAKTLESPADTLPDWQTVIAAEQDVQARQPNDTSREVVRDLYRWQVALLQRLDRDEEAIAAIRRTVNLLDGTVEQVTEIVDWLSKCEAWTTIEEVAERFPDAFNDSPLLLYRLAETQRKLSKADAATATADRAAAIRPDSLDEHLRVAYLLQSKGLFDWSEREYRMVMKGVPPGSIGDFNTRFILSEMLHDQERDDEAADVLQPLADLMDKDEAAKAKAVDTNRDPEAIYARLNFFRAQHVARTAPGAEARERLLKALEYDPTDADVLITLYRLPNDAEQAAAIKEKVESATKVFRDEIAEFSRNLEQAPNEPSRAIFNAQVATSCNQFAWLVANTFGDFDEALRASLRSLELKPNTAGYLDTLGRCYYAKDDLENAVKTQTLAAKLDPNALAIQRQLDFFRAAAAKQQQAPKSPPPTP